MSEQLTKYKGKLPTINDLYSSDLAILDKQNSVNILLNQEPKKEWIKEHPIAKNVKYIPIERVEWLLTNIFIRWRVEILDAKLIANSATVTVRLHYRDPITGEWDWMDGLGAAPLQTDKGQGATDWAHIKSDSVMKGLPAAESFAVKDAAEKLGKLFGKDLNRADKIMYDTLQGKFESKDRAQFLIDLIDQLPEIGLQNMYKDDCKKARESGKFTPEFIETMIKKVQNDLL
jgi:hypothetical protein